MINIVYNNDNNQYKDLVFKKRSNAEIQHILYHFYNFNKDQFKNYKDSKFAEKLFFFLVQNKPVSVNSIYSMDLPELNKSLRRSELLEGEDYISNECVRIAIVHFTLYEEHTKTPFKKVVNKIKEFLK